MQAYLSRMFRYVAWADARAIESVRACPASQEKCVPLLAHLLAAEHVWLSRLQQRTPVHAVWPTLTLDECQSLAAENATGFANYIDQISPEELERTITYRTSQGQEFSTPAIDILTQVITHGPYHRGQIAKIIGQAGGSPIITDFIIFGRESAPIAGDQS